MASPDSSTKPSQCLAVDIAHLFTFVDTAQSRAFSGNIWQRGRETLISLFSINLIYRAVLPTTLSIKTQAHIKEFCPDLQFFPSLAAAFYQQKLLCGELGQRKPEIYRTQRAFNNSSQRGEGSVFDKSFIISIFRTRRKSINPRPNSDGKRCTHRLHICFVFPTKVHKWIS